MAPNDRDDDHGGAGGKKLTGILKKAVSLGAGAYLTAEDTVNKTLSTIQIPKDLLRESLENLFDSYTIQVTAEIKLKPKKKTKEETSE